MWYVLLYILFVKIMWLFFENNIIVVVIVVIFELNVNLVCLFFNIVIIFFKVVCVGLFVCEYLYF